MRFAKKLGINSINAMKTDIDKYVLEKTSGIGSDGVLITASSKSKRNHF